MLTENQEKLAAVFDLGFWERLSPDLTIGGELDPYAFDLDRQEHAVLAGKLETEGYIHLESPGFKSPIEEMVKTFSSIVKLGLPPVFAFVYDETWMFNTQLRNVLTPVLGNNYMLLPAFWAWLVAPGEEGWPPHRDKPKLDFMPDKGPKSVTVWIPLTQSHPLNSCMYVLPANRDKLYGVPNNMAGFPGQLSDIRALPAKAGDVLIWTPQLMHWGSHSADNHKLPPRMNLAFEYQRGDIAPLTNLLLDPFKLPSFQERLALIARQIMQYRSMYSYTEDLIMLARQIRERHGLPVNMPSY